MKKLILTIAILSAQTTFAAPDFNKLIEENNKIQNELYQSLRKNLHKAQTAAVETKKQRIRLDTGAEIIVSPTNLKAYTETSEQLSENNLDLLDNELAIERN